MRPTPPQQFVQAEEVASVLPNKQKDRITEKRKNPAAPKLDFLRSRP